MPFWNDLGGDDISIHAPAKGATFQLLANKRLTTNFNPRTREGCDNHDRRTKWQKLNFNPRTREGCDFSEETKHDNSTNFNPRTREGCDMQTNAVPAVASLFQSTHPRRVRHALAIGVNVQEVISIHAPAKGATCCTNDTKHWRLKFQSTHPRRVRPRRRFCASLYSYFNPRTREGCDSASLHRLWLKQSIMELIFPKNQLF